MSNDQNQNRQHGNRNNDRRDRNRDRGPKTFSKGEQMEVVFAKQPVGSGSRIVSFLQDGTVIYPKSLRFKPVPGKKYQCSVKFRENSRGTFGLALPSLPMTLSPKEWIPVEELRSCLVVNLVFEQKRGREGQDARLIAFHEGRAVFPDNGTTVLAGKQTACLLREAGNVAFAIPVGVTESTGKGLMRLSEKLGEVLESDLRHIVVKVATKKSGVTGMPKTEAELEIGAEYRNIFEVLSGPDAKVKLDESSSEDEINKAYRRMAIDLHPDKVAQDFGGGDKLPLPVKKNAEFFFEALGLAKEKAIELLSRKKGKSENAGPAKANQSEGNASAPKADGRKRDRRPRKDRNAERQQIPVAPAAPVEAEAPKADAQTVVTEEPQAEEPVLSQNDVPTVPAPAEEPAEAVAATEAKSETDGDASSEVDPLVAGLAQELHEPADVVIEALNHAKMGPAEFVGLAPNVQKFHLKYARGNVQRAKAAQKGGGNSKKAEAKGGAGQSKDWRAQLADAAKK